MNNQTLKCMECGADLKVNGNCVEGCYMCADQAYCEGLEDGRIGVMAGEKRHFIEVDESFYKELKDYAKKNQTPLRQVVSIIMIEFMKRKEVVA